MMDPKKVDATGIRTIARRYLEEFAKLVTLVNLDAVERVVDRLNEARERRANIYIAGNGGSAAIASHWVNDLGKATKRDDATPMRVMSLSDNSLGSLPWPTMRAMSACSWDSSRTSRRVVMCWSSSPLVATR